MLYRFIDDFGTFQIKNPHRHKLYFPLADSRAKLLSAIAPNLSGDIKKDNDHFLTLPASVEDLRSSPLCCREFFIKVNGKVIRLSRPGDDTLEAGFLYHKINKKVKGLEIEALNFIPFDLPVEVMRIKVKNISRKNISIEPTSFIPLFGRSEKNLRDHRHVSSLLNRVSLDKFGISLKPSMVFDEKGHKLNAAIYFCRGFEANTVAPLGQFPTLDYFYGENDICCPDAIFKNVVPVNKKKKEFDGKEACAGLRFRKRQLVPGKEAQYFLFLGIEEKEAEITRKFRQLNSPEKVEIALEKTKDSWRKYLSGLKIDFKDSGRNGWLAWVKFQPTLRKMFGCSFLPHFDYGKGGRGWRDLWQDALTLLLTEPEKAREIIIKSFAGVRLDGSNATIIGRDDKLLADRNRINRVWMDHGVWPYLTTLHYLNRTGDLDFLLKTQTYFRDHQLRRAKAVDPGFSQKDFIQRDKLNRVFRGSILEHILIENLVQFFNVGDHNVVRLENADWNDGLDMASDKGESAAFSFMYAHNLRSLCDLLRALKKRRSGVSLLKELTLLLDTLRKPINYNDPKAKQKLLNRYFEEIGHISGARTEVRLEELIFDLEAKYRHMSGWLSGKEWLKEGFFNGYYDDQGLRVEGKSGSSAIRMMLTSQVFAIMSAVAKQSQVNLAWKSIKKHLFDKELGGFRLNTDLKKPYLKLGRAFGFSYGDKENGAFFSHMNVMLANALYKRGLIDEGHEVLDSLFRMATSDKAGIPPVLPEYFNAQGKGRYLYLTGSASWYIHTLFEEVLGIKFELGDVFLEPKLLAGDFFKKRIETEFCLGNKKIKLVYQLKSSRQENKPLAIKEVLLDGKKMSFQPDSCRIKTSLLRSSFNLINLTLG
jgi:cellobiose phosphorylase